VATPRDLRITSCSTSGLGTSRATASAWLGRAIVRQRSPFHDSDEPLGALDSSFDELMWPGARALHDRLHATTVYVPQRTR